MRLRYKSSGLQFAISSEESSDTNCYEPGSFKINIQFSHSFALIVQKLLNFDTHVGTSEVELMA